MKQGRGTRAVQLIFLGLVQWRRLRDEVQFADIARRSFFVDLSAYPEWLVVLVGTLAAALIIWIMIKLLKWALWLLFLAVLIGGVLWSMYLLIN